MDMETIHRWLSDRVPVMDRGSVERCGVIVGERDGDDFTVQALYELPNSAPDPTQRFGIKSHHISALGPVSLRIIGSWHCHSAAHDDGPSIEDIKLARDGTWNLVWNPTRNSVTVYRSQKEGGRVTVWTPGDRHARR